jgi:protein phosphatase
MNQDFYYCSPIQNTHMTIGVVCDGMGGALSGDIASELACRTFVEELHNRVSPKMGAKAMRTSLIEAVRLANAKVYERSKEDPRCDGMGTTLVGGLIASSKAVLINVGDSRAYLADSEGIQQITRDHSLVEVMLERGDLSETEARNHPSRNLITRALGTEPDVQCDLFTLDLRENDYLLLCSDGLSNVVEPQEMLYEILHGGAPSECCQRLIDLANERGGPDNITAVLLAI